MGFAIAVLVAGALAHAFAEVLSQAGGWGLSFELADPVRAGTYQGVFSMGYSLGAIVAPLVRHLDRHRVRPRRLGDARRDLPRLGARHLGDRAGRSTFGRTRATRDRLTGASTIVAA